MPPTEGGAGDPQKRKDLADLLRGQAVYPKPELFWFAPYFMLAPPWLLLIIVK